MRDLNLIRAAYMVNMNAYIDHTSLCGHLIDGLVSGSEEAGASQRMCCSCCCVAF